MPECGAVAVGVLTRRSVIEEVVIDVNLFKLAHEHKLAGQADIGSLPATSHARSS